MLRGSLRSHLSIRVLRKRERSLDDLDLGHAPHLSGECREPLLDALAHQVDEFPRHSEDEALGAFRLDGDLR